MCNPNWTALECISATYLIQVLLIFIGMILGFIGLITRDISSILVDQKPLLKIKDFEFNPQMPRKTRLGLKNAGIGLITIGVVWVMVLEYLSPLITRVNSLPINPVPTTVSPSQPVNEMPFISNISLAGITYISGGWNPRQIDLLSASTEGIGLDTESSLKLLDLQVMVSDVTSAVPYQVQAKVFANGDKEIGETKFVDLTPGIVLLGEVFPTSFQHSTASDAWLPQKDWGKLTIKLNIVDSDKQIVQFTKTDILFADKTRSWFITPPYANFISIVFQVNDGEKLLFDLRSGLIEGVGGIAVSPGDKLRIHEIWYHALADDDTKQLFAEAYLSSGEYDEETYFQTAAVNFKKGSQDLLKETPLEWLVPEGKKSLVLTLSRNNDNKQSTVLDRYEIMFSPNAQIGLIPIPEPRTWPQGNMIYLDFENDGDVKNWVAAQPVQIDLSRQFAISGKQSLSVTVNSTNPNTKQETAVRDVHFKASMIIGQVFWPEQQGTDVEWAQFCVTQAWQCVRIPVDTGQWNSFFMDLSSMKGVDEKTLSQTDLPSFFIQGSFASGVVGTPYTFYVDGIQIYPTLAP